MFDSSGGGLRSIYPAAVWQAIRMPYEGAVLLIEYACTTDRIFVITENSSIIIGLRYSVPFRYGKE